MTGYDVPLNFSRIFDMKCWLLQALITTGKAAFMELCQPWVQRLLLGAGSLTALSIHLRTIPGLPIAQLPYLRHLEVSVSLKSFHCLDGFFDSVSHCSSLESLGVMFDAGKEAIGLPSMYLQGMPRLKHVRLGNCLPGQDLALPADCSVFLDALHTDDLMWQLHWDTVERYTTVLRLDYRHNQQWPQGLQSFSNLQYLELTVWQVWNGDLADFQHIPHVRVILDDSSNLQLTGGSWETFEIFHFGGLRVSIRDIESFVRGTKDFTFISESPHGASIVLMEHVRYACLRQGKACHFTKRYDERCGKHGAAYDKELAYVVLSTKKKIAENFEKGILVICNCDKAPKVSFERDETLANWEDFWPCNPFDSVRRV